mmetsp:Transcript_71979/g.158948  ORF Transcript_71979/g.158948 Transcript_71979/m.158948 type:complete len:82 (-) Transcript_71979:300-545(-)
MGRRSVHGIWIVVIVKGNSKTPFDAYAAEEDKSIEPGPCMHDAWRMAHEVVLLRRRPTLQTSCPSWAAARSGCWATHHQQQ